MTDMLRAEHLRSKARCARKYANLQARNAVPFGAAASVLDVLADVLETDAPVEVAEYALSVANIAIQEVKDELHIADEKIEGEIIPYNDAKVSPPSSV